MQSMRDCEDLSKDPMINLLYAMSVEQRARKNNPQYFHFKFDVRLRYSQIRAS